MAKIKEKEKVAEYLNQVMEEKGMKRAKLAEEIAKLKCNDVESFNSEKDAIKVNITKWLDKTNARYPGTDYIYFLSCVLGVSIEEILLCGETHQKLDTRATLYSAAKCSTSQQCELLINSILKSYDDSPHLTKLRDEYDKTLLDYVIEFENIALLRYLVDNDLYTTFYDFCPPIREIKSFEILDIVASNDDVDLWKKLIDPQYRFISEECMDEGVYSYNDISIAIKPDLIKKIAESKHLLEYIKSPYVPLNQRYSIAKHSGVSLIQSQDEKVDIKSIKRLNGLFNVMLNHLLRTNNYKADSFLEVAITHCKYMSDKLKPMLDGKPFESRDKVCNREIVLTFPNIICLDEISSPEIKEKAIYCQTLVDTILKTGLPIKD